MLVSFAASQHKNQSMKKTVLTLACAGLAASAFAQNRHVGEAIPMHRTDLTHSAARDADTLYSPLLDEETTQPTQYGALDGDNNPAGFIFGTNTYGDFSKARTFLATGSTAVTGILFWAGTAYDSGNGRHLTMNLHAMNGTGYVPDGTGEPVETTEAPGTILGSVDMPMSEIEGSLSTLWNVVEFPTPVTVPDFFTVAFNFENLTPLDNSGTPGDSLSIVTTADGEVQYTDFAWEQWSDGSWWTLSVAWPIDFDPYLLVAVDDAYVGIHDAGTFNGMRMSFLNGNPISGQVLQVGYTTEKAATVKALVMDATGRVVLNKELGNVGAGSHSLDIDASDWVAGQYFVSLIADGKPITKKVSKL